MVVPVDISEQQEEMQQQGVASVRTRKTRTLQDLFRPPIDLTYKGTFANVRYLSPLELADCGMWVLFLTASAAMALINFCQVFWLSSVLYQYADRQDTTYSRILVLQNSCSASVSKTDILLKSCTVYHWVYKSFRWYLLTG